MIGTTSISPKPLAVYRMGGWSTINVWQLLARKLPAQLAILCHDKARSVTELATETGTPAVYIEDELEILVNAGLLLTVGRDRYRTNFHILKSDTMNEIEANFRALYAAYAPYVIDAFKQYLPALRETDAFDHAVDEDRYRWLWAEQIRHSISLGKKCEMPRILADGCYAYVYAAESKKHRWGRGQSCLSFNDADVLAVDYSVFGQYHFQNELADERKSAYLCDFALGRHDGSLDRLLTAQLVELGYLTHADGQLCCNVMCITPTVRAFIKTVNAELAPTLSTLFGNTAEKIRRIVHETIPEQLREYADGFAAEWIGNFSGLYFYEALEQAGFLRLPDDKHLPIACSIRIK